ncbi:MAG TPA: competence protein CoiA family protein [Acidimicrobiia bacterium]|nr:competence protein CoiA family protein [Acidimicrobiia bacterium]
METAAGPSSDVRCPACSRLLVLRSGPKVAPHYAHRPRQSCRNRPGGAGRAPLRLEQLTLFELPPLELPPMGAVFEPFAGWGSTPVADGEPRSSRPSVQRAGRRRRRRWAWLPRLLRWVRGGRGPASPGLHP